MDVTVTVTGQHPEDELPSLRSWLVGDDDLAGLVAGTAPEASTGSAGAGPIAVAVGSRGAATALADALVAWIRGHSRDVVYEVARPDGESVRIPARGVRRTDGAAVRDLIAELCRAGGEGRGDGGGADRAALDGTAEPAAR